MEEIYRILKEIKPECDFYSSENYIDDFLLESMDVIELVARLEEEFHICFDIMDIVPETFRNANSIYEVIQKYG